jgi:23S rRNA (adenine2503-C2)-methyltransferase
MTQPAPAPAHPLSGLDLMSTPRAKLRERLEAAGERAFRADQIFVWLHGRGARDLGAMTDLPGGLRAALQEHAAPLAALPVVDEQVSEIDGSEKLALQTPYGAPVETVLMPMQHGVTQCLSSQVGCKMRCDFCATARMAVRANLTAGEIVEQVAIACRRGAAAGRVRGGVGGRRGEAGDKLSARPSNLVFMGMGEPLDNLDALLDALDILTDDKGYGFSPRRITVSTSGLGKRIPPLAAAQPDVNIAWSLTATTDELRTRLMPVNKAVPIDMMVDILANLPQSKSRKLTFEYAIFQDVNDSPDDADRLGAMARHLDAHVNIIPFNAWEGSDYERPSRNRVRRFSERTRAQGASVSVRESKGRDIDAACGQLASRERGPTAA